MPECPQCLGEGTIDFTDSDDEIERRFTHAELVALLDEGRLEWPLGIITCDECEGTGVVSQDRLRDIQAWSVAQVDQAIAEYNRRVAAGIIPSPPAG